MFTFDGKKQEFLQYVTNRNEHESMNLFGGEMFMPRRRKKEEVNVVFLMIIFLLLLASIFILSPAILITSLISLIVDTEIGPLWGTTLIVTAIIIGTMYWKWGGEGLIKKYLIICSIVSFIGLLFCLFVNDNFIIDTIYKMYPVFES
jgi:Na+/proline symporter